VAADAKRLSEGELAGLVRLLLEANGVEALTAGAVASTIVAAERDGTHSHGLARIPGYLSSLKSGWVDGAAVMTIQDRAPGVVFVDANNGFAQGALARASEVGMEKARRNGIAAICIHDSHNFASLWPDLEPFALAGFVALGFVHSRARIVAPGSRRPVLGTNPIAVAVPRKDALPIVWDMAASPMAHGDVILAAKSGKALPEGVGVNRHGNPTTDAQAVLDGGALLPYAGHKGFLAALLVEVMAAALTGSRFGFEDTSAAIPGAVTSNAGQTILLVNPGSTTDDFAGRIEQLVLALADAGVERLPADRRYANRARSSADGIPVSAANYELLLQR
jgi:delta1-piperideine-2-carboxylate reductase